MVYAIGLSKIFLLVLNWFVFTNRLYSVDYFHLVDTLPQITQFFLSFGFLFNFLNPFLIMISTVFIFFLEVKKGVIPGMLGFVLYAMNDINVMVVSTRALILRIFVLVFYFCIQVVLIYLILKPKEKEIEKIKNIVIDMSDKYTITTIKEIAETVNNLITVGDINADYFKRSNTVAFYK